MKDAKILTKMSGSVILDTNVVIKFFGGDKSVVDNTALSDSIYIPTIVFGELFYGAYNSKNAKSNIEKLEQYFNSCECLECNFETSKYYGNIKSKLNSVEKLIDNSIESVQKISSKLRPGLLDELGLIPAIEWQTQEFMKNTGIDCEYTLPKEEIILDQEKSTALFRIFQESIFNTARHANASKILINLREINNDLVLEIIDNGKGITQSQISDPKSLGLLGMKERALILGGSVEIKSSMNNGTIIKAVIPFINKKIN